MKSVSNIGSLLSFAWRYPRQLLLGISMAIAGTLLGFVFPGIARVFVDDIIPHRKVEAILATAGLAIGVFALRQLFYALRTLANNRFELLMIYDLRSALHHKIQHLPMSWFNRHRSGDVIARMSDDVPATQRVIIDAVDQAIPALLQIGFAMGIMFWLHTKLTLITLIPVPFIIAGGWIYARYVAPRERSAREAAAELNGVLQDSVEGVRQIKSYGLQSLRQQQFNLQSAEYRQQKTLLQRAWAIYGPGMNLFGDMGLVLLLAYGAYWSIQGELSAGQVVQFLLYIGMLYEPMGRLHGINQTFQQGLASARRIFEVLEESADEEEMNAALPALIGNVHFRQVNFSYSANRPVLKQLNFKVQAGQTVAIVGGTGSGKSTIFQLLLRFYEVQSGEIELDGKNLQQWSKKHIREQITYISQEPYLFDQSLRDNLLLACPEASEAELWQALTSASAKEFVAALPKGLDTLVGENGKKFSAGERQRIALARAFLKPASILLLDEATSALDRHTEWKIQQSLVQLRKGKTCLIIAHRLSTILDADCILVLKDGRIQAQGTHAALMSQGGYYAKLITMSFHQEDVEQLV